VADAVRERPGPVVAILVLLFGAMAWSAVREKSVTFDEIAHLTAGYSYWLTGDFRLQPENGNLPQRWIALPLLALQLRFPELSDPHWHSSNVWELGYNFFYRLDNDLDAMLWRGRGMIVLVGMALGVIVFAWSRRLFGVAGGLLSLTMYAFCPSLLAHTALATSDMTVTLMFAAALGTFWLVLERVSVASVLAAGGALGGLLVAKVSAVVIFPVLLLLLLLRLIVALPLSIRWRGKEFVVPDRIRQMALLLAVVVCQGLLAVLVIWASYGFQYSTFRTAAPAVDRMPGNQTVDSLAGDGPLGTGLRLADHWHLLPEPYLFGFAFAVRMSEKRVAFFNGEFGEQGWRLFFPYTLLVKTPLPTLALLLAALLAAIVHRPSAARGLYCAAPLIVFLLVYWAIAVRTNLNIGHRHILPTYPLMFILGGAAAKWFQSRNQLVRVMPLLLVAWLVVESVGTWPNYLAYFNQLAGGPRNGYRHLVDSSLDWGQDLPALRQRLAARPAASRELPVYLSYFGVGNPTHYGLRVRQLPAYPDWRTEPETGDLAPGTYCISATNLQGVYIPPRGPWSLESEQMYQRLRAAVGRLAKRQREQPLTSSQSATLSEFEAYRFARLCAYLRLREPDDSAGYSILIYDLAADDLRLALDSPLSDWLAVASRSN
jgi:hypothetical protein